MVGGFPEKNSLYSSLCPEQSSSLTVSPLLNTPIMMKVETITNPVPNNPHPLSHYYSHNTPSYTSNPNYPDFLFSSQSFSHHPTSPSHWFPNFPVFFPRCCVYPPLQQGLPLVGVPSRRLIQTAEIRLGTGTVGEKTGSERGRERVATWRCFDHGVCML